MRVRYLFVLSALAVVPQCHAAGTVSICDQTHLLAALSGGGNVTFSCIGVITLTSTIVISTDTSIDGTGQSVTLSGGGSVQVMQVSSGVKLTLTSLTISGGNASFKGGGLANSGLLTVNGCTFQGNTAFTAGAIANYNIASITNSSFLDNSATYPNGADGGAISTYGRSLTVTGSTFTHNSVNGFGFGGAIFAGSAAYIWNSTFTSNSTYYGGAISVYGASGTLFVSGGAFTNNSAAYGGAIFNGGGTATAQLSTLSGNQATLSGGAVYQAFSSASTLVGNCKISQNSATYGGGIGTEAGSLTIADATIDSNTATGNGGGLASSSFSPTSPTATVVQNSTFSQNSAPFGGGIHNAGGAQLFVSGSTFSRNNATGVGGQGGAIDNDAAGPLTVTNSTFYVNVAASGGAIFNSSSQSIVSYSTLVGPLCIFGPCPPNNLLGGSAAVTLESSILAFGNPNCQTSPIDGGYNLDNGNSCRFSSLTHSLVNTNPLLTLFGNHGGPTSTLGLQPIPPATTPVSPAIGKIPLTVNGCGTTVTRDQRSVSRRVSGTCDIGAVQHLNTFLPASGSTCNGTYNQTFKGDVTIYAGQTCVFVGGGITGNVQVKGGRFEVLAATVGGNVEIEHGSTFSIGPSAIITGSLEIHNLEETGGTDDRQDSDSNQAETAIPRNRVCGARVNGGLDVHNNESSIAIGAQNLSLCAGNTIGGSLDIHNNGGATVIDANTVTGDLIDHNNDGPTQIFRNLIKGTLECRENSSIAGGQNSAKQKQGQCASF